MCLIMLFGMLVYMIVGVFFETARMLLPWTIGATGLSILATYDVGTIWLAKFRPQLPFYALVSFALTMLFGYIGFWLLPPWTPPPEPPKKGLAHLAEVLLEQPKMNINRDALLAMLPVHLAISGSLGAVIAESIVSRREAKREMSSPDLS